MTELTWDARWMTGLPPHGADRCWLGESADGRQWLLKWEPGDRRCWVGAGFFRDPNWSPGVPTSPEFRLMVGEGAAFIVRHMALPATMIEGAS